MFEKNLQQSCLNFHAKSANNSSGFFVRFLALKSKHFFMKQSNFNEQNFNFLTTLWIFTPKTAKSVMVFLVRFLAQKIVLLNFYTKNPDFEQNFDVKTIGKSTIRKKNPNSIFCQFPLKNAFPDKCYKMC